MSKRTSCYWMIIALIGIIVVFPCVGQTDIRGAGALLTPDYLHIPPGNAGARDEMPAVGFLHDMHTRALDGNCTACHIREDDGLHFSFKRTDPGPGTMALYHEACIGCHLDTRASGQVSGPETAQCGLCHRAGQDSAVTGRTPLVFDRELHYLHETSAQIPGTDPAFTDNCSRCHHQYNAAEQKIFYARGEESACTYCHRAESGDPARSMRRAAHDDCVNCHQDLHSRQIDTGPVTCDGCHGPESREKFRKPDSPPPRLMRNQPDTVLLMQQPVENRKFMEGVVFNHQTHETGTGSCKVCHHETLNKCSGCHTREGIHAEGGGISLEQAMHRSGSAQSCIGCHETLTRGKDCAGCHAMMPASRAGAESCRTCHNQDTPRPAEESLESAMATALADRAAGYETVPREKIPETVVIDVLSDVYRPTELPHRKIFDAIVRRTESSSLATVFHKDQTALCMGCHHNTPRTQDPPRCVTCHDKKGPGPDGRPGLMGAYHGQCISCHQRMDIASLPATDCVRCHANK